MFFQETIVVFFPLVILTICAYYCWYCLFAKLCWTLQPHELEPPGSSVHETPQARILEWVATSFSRGLPDLGTKPLSLTLQVNSLPLNHQGSPILLYSALNIFFFLIFLQVYSQLPIVNNEENVFFFPPHIFNGFILLLIILLLFYY